MSKYNKAFNSWLDTRTNFYLHKATYDEMVHARIKYLKEKSKLFSNN